MNDKFDVGVWGMGVAVGFAICFCLWMLQWGPYRDKLDICEAELPRSQHCTLIAVSEEPAS